MVRSLALNGSFECGQQNFRPSCGIQSRWWQRIARKQRAKPKLEDSVTEMKRPVPFTKAQVRRAVEAAASAGLRVQSVTVNPDGSITINSGDKLGPAMDTRETALAGWDDL